MAVDSLKKYRRADLQDERGQSLIKDLYVDPLPNEQILKTCLEDNTTFLVGRKGTGKSTIFLRLEQSYLLKPQYLSCYIDVKTLFETSGFDGTSGDYLKDNIPEPAIGIYLIHRTFIQSVLTGIIQGIEKKHLNNSTYIKWLIGADRSQKVSRKLKELNDRISNNEILQKIELPAVAEVKSKIQGSSTSKSEDVVKGKLGIDLSVGAENVAERTKTSAWENNFSSIFLKVFQIKNIIIEIKEILSELKITHLIIMLDDFSEIDEGAIKTFVDTIMAPLNNWSDEFIKFKVAAYPGRVFYGSIDPGKIDIQELDFYSLYKMERGSMEERAVDFTKRLILSRLSYYCKCKDIGEFFDLSSDSAESYFEVLFQSSMNIPRILGYILFYCYQSNIVYGNLINRKAIENAAQIYYDKNIYPFFNKTTYSLMSYGDKISILQHKELMEKYIANMKDIKKRITSGELSSNIYNKYQPYTSHFNIIPQLETFLSSLELNFFLTKYGEMSDRDGRKVSVYAINYGLAVKNNLRWGKQSGNEYRKYFIARPFDFSGITSEFLKNARKIVCSNPQCGKTYPFDDIEKFKIYKMACPNCGALLEIVPVSKTIEDELKRIDSSLLLPPIDYSLLYELNKYNKPVHARDIAEELDVSSHLVGKIAKRLDEEKGLIERTKTTKPYTYKVSNSCKYKYFSGDSKA